MDSDNQNAAADEVAAEFIGSLLAGEAPATPTPEPTTEPIPAAAPASAEKSVEAEQIVSVPISGLDPFPSHPFQVRDDEEMAYPIESIKEYGVLTPLTVRKKDERRYELVSRRRRKRVYKLAGATKGAVARWVTEKWTGEPPLAYSLIDHFQPQGQPGNVWLPLETLRRTTIRLSGSSGIKPRYCRPWQMQPIS